MVSLSTTSLITINVLGTSKQWSPILALTKTVYIIYYLCFKSFHFRCVTVTEELLFTMFNAHLREMTWLDGNRLDSEKWWLIEMCCLHQKSKHCLKFIHGVVFYYFDDHWQIAIDGKKISYIPPNCCLSEAEVTGHCMQILCIYWKNVLVFNSGHFGMFYTLQPWWPYWNLKH